MAALRYDELFRDAERASARLEAATERAVISAYKAALKSIRAQLAEAYAKHAKGDALSYADMSRYNRLVSMFDNINAELAKMTGEKSRLINRLGEDVYQAGFYRTAYAVEAGGELVSINWGLLRPEVISTAVQNPISGLTLSERLAPNRAEIILKIREQITQSLIQGESYPKVAKRIKATLDNDATKAMRVVRTEAHRVSQEGRLEAIDRAIERGVDAVKIWNATLDDRTRTEHGAMDGQQADEEGYFHAPTGERTRYPGGFGVAGLDIQCRCVLLGQIRGFAPEVRRVRGEGVVPYKTYATWAKEKGIAG